MIALAAVISAKLLRSPLTNNDAQLPGEHLLATPMRSLLLLLGRLGNAQRIAQGHTSTKDRDLLVPAASELLSNWPHNFHAMLAKAGASDGGAIQIQRRFHRLVVRRLFSEKPPLENIEFVRDEFARFAQSPSGKAVIHPRMPGYHRLVDPGRYVSQSQIASEYGVTQSTIRYLRKVGLITSVSNVGIVLDREQVRHVLTGYTTAIGAQRVGRRLKIPVPVVQALIAAGLLQTVRTRYRRVPLTVLDKFVERLLATARRSDAAAAQAETITLRAALRSSCLIKGKVEVLRRLLDGTLRPVRGEPESLSQLLLVRSELSGLLVGWRSVRSPASTTQR